MIDLDSFLARFLDTRLNALFGSDLELRDFGLLISKVIYRDPPFQVELVTLKPSRAYPAFPDAHRHPHVDSYEVHLGGDVQFTVDDVVHDSKSVAGCVLAKRAVRVPRSAWHSAKWGPNGGMFLSVQRWDGLEPTTVGFDWEGKLLSSRHERLIERAG
jgi:hypothetical protein